MITAYPCPSEDQSRQKIQIQIDNQLMGIHQYISVSPFTQIGQLKSMIEDIAGIQTKNQRLFCQNYEMKNSDVILDYVANYQQSHDEILKELSLDLSFNHDVSTTSWAEDVLELQLVPKNNGQLGNIQIIREFNNVQMDKTIAFIQQGINKGLKPLEISDGVSGSYFMRDQYRNNVAIFKCIDEEPFAPNNQKGYVNLFGKTSFRNGIKSGEVCLREIAAYYLDDKKIHCVPTTTVVELRHPYFKDKFQYEMKTKKGFFKNKFI